MKDYQIPSEILSRAREIKAQHNSIASERETEPGAYIVCKRMNLDEAIEIAQKEAIDKVKNSGGKD